MEKKQKYICISTNSLFKGILIAIVLVAAVFVLFLPRTDLFKGSLIQTKGPVEEPIEVQEIEAGSIVVEYLKERDEIEVKSGSSAISLGKLAFKVGEESVEVSGITLELEGDASPEMFEGMSLNFNNEKVEKAEFVWLSKTSLFIDLVGVPFEVVEYGEIELFADIAENASEKRAGFHFVEVIAQGVNSNKEITNVGVNGMLDPVPLFINLK
ncbi:hypothetical protein ACFL3C_03835 [Patescibacteria group bacterium]